MKKIISYVQAVLGICLFFYLIGLVGSVDLNRLTVEGLISKLWYFLLVGSVMLLTHKLIKNID